MKKVFWMCLLVMLIAVGCKSSKIEVVTESNQSDNTTGEFKTVEIGNQIWMAENLNIPTENGSWLWNHDNELKGKIYGRLYDWETAAKLCPEGWRMPTIEDFLELTKNYGAYDIIGSKLKAAKFWDEDTANASDNLFNALPAGYYTGDPEGSFLGEKSIAKFWTATESEDKNHAYFFYLETGSPEFKDDFRNKKYGLSVRYIKIK